MYRLSSKENMKELVYCAHSHYTTDRSRDVAIFVLKQGHFPIDPFLTIPPAIFDELRYTEDECVDTDINILARCDELWIFGGGNTPGVSKEIAWWSKNRAHRIIKYITWDEVPNVFA